MRRRNGWKHLACLASALLITFSVPSPANATVVVPLTRAQLVDRSDLVVRATVIDQWSTWNEDQSQIITLTRLRVLSYLRGSGPQELVLRQFGGTVDGLVSRVPGDAHLSQGQEWVLFLRRGERVVYLTALAQSAYLVRRSPGAPATVHRDLQELTFASQQGGRMILTEPTPEPAETLEHLEHDVRTLSGGSR